MVSRRSLVEAVTATYRQACEDKPSRALTGLEKSCPQGRDHPLRIWLPRGLVVLDVVGGFPQVLVDEPGVAELELAPRLLHRLGENVCAERLARHRVGVRDGYPRLDAFFLDPPDADAGLTAILGLLMPLSCVVSAGVVQ